MSSTHVANVAWKRRSEDFRFDSYSRDHLWRLGSGTTILASATPEFRGNPALVNPEEAFVAAVSSCHMLTFLSIAARKGLVVDSYEDHAVGYLDKNEQGRIAITRITLQPRVAFGGERIPDPEELARLHEQAHAGCFVANSIRATVEIEPIDCSAPAEPTAPIAH